MLFSSILIVSANFVIGSPIHSTHHVETRLVYEYPQMTGWLENIAVRKNGQLVMTSLGKPGSLNVLDPCSDFPNPYQITGFEYNDTLGIVETTPDVFYVLAANFSLQTVKIENGTNAVWKVDFNQHDPKPAKIVTLTDAVFLNGLTAFNDSILLAADSALGVVWGIDLKSSTYWKVSDDPLMKPVLGQSYVEGINGLHMRSSHGLEKDLCFTNSQQYIFACIELDKNVKSIGPASVVARPAPEKGFTAINWDDFAFDSHGSAYVATEKGNSVQRISPEGKVMVVAGDLNSTEIATPTATAFARTRKDSRTVYAVTAGGLAFPVIINGTGHRTGAQIVAIDLNSYE